MRPWIKFNITLFTDPRVDAIASAIASHAARYIMDAQHAKDLFGVTESVTCHALRDVTVTALLRIFIAGNEHTTDGIFRHVSSIAYLDLLAGITGMGAAMQKVGWALFDKATQTITLVNFLEYNSPGKNGQRTVSKEAERKRKERERKRQASETSGSETSSSGRDMSRGQESDSHVTSSISISISNSESESESESKIRTGSADVSSALDSGSGQPPPPADRDPLGTLKKRINDLRPAWTKAPHWSGEEEQVLFEARHNLFAIEEQDWLILGWFFKWVTTAANTGTQNAVQATTRRHQFVRELASYLDRATTAWKQERCPKLGDATKPSSKPKPKPKPAPMPEERATASSFAASLAAHGGQPPPARPTSVADHLLNDLGIQPRTLPPPDFDSPAYKALVAAQTQQTAHTASAA
ncbi:MAG: hypothetical protein WAW39_28910 [Prosthecobacter sp.]|uniref:hypothetical protein n=1 Tax=Prosthecobacter sp. TaxID=1965333 RepID=UPI003BB14AA6